MKTSLRDRLDGQHTPLSEDQAQVWRDQGHWENKSLRSILTKAALDYPARQAVIGYDASGRTGSMTYAELDAQAHHVASVLDSLGLAAGDSVVVMLPNWIEYASFVYGILEAGASYTGIPVAYGPNQVRSVLARSKAKAIVIPRRYLRNEHLSMIRAMRSELPHLEQVIVVDDHDADLLAGERLWSSFDGVAVRAVAEPDPGRICYIGFTSGTTGEPKGAMHSHETLYYSVRQLADHIGRDQFGEHPTQLVASPIGHHTGFVWGILLTTFLGGTGVYVDRWDPRWGIDVIYKENATFFVGAPTFLQDMIQTKVAGDPNSPLVCMIIAGAPVPRNLPQEASKALGAYIAPAWGMTECSILSSCTPAQTDEILTTDGSVFAGSEVRIVGSSGEELAVGEAGELQIRGPGVCLGYYDRPDATNDSFAGGLWFRTGDTAEVDERGWLSLRGRIKDMIIRGGENIPVTEVESLIFDHPAVLQAAVIGIPDQRLGERICAVLVTRDDAELTREELSDYLLSRGLSRHYLPETVVIRQQMPVTPSGKIKKVELRDAVTASISQ